MPAEATTKTPRGLGLSSAAAGSSSIGRLGPQCPHLENKDTQAPAALTSWDRWLKSSPADPTVPFP